MWVPAESGEIPSQNTAWEPQGLAARSVGSLRDQGSPAEPDPGLACSRLPPSKSGLRDLQPPRDWSEKSGSTRVSIPGGCEDTPGVARGRGSRWGSQRLPPGSRGVGEESSCTSVGARTPLPAREQGGQRELPIPARALPPAPSPWRPDGAAWAPEGCPFPAPGLPRSSAPAAGAVPASPLPGSALLDVRGCPGTG
ncbi:MAPK-interacting and spindle-stabilizing protein-like [Pseudopipra pipra]|uniref:MAPK-interacting and spindle-stabilizing protein-like n=1 Tax=Pseudopipra pipra TaxID=415032 RepID=UPI003138BF56